MTVKLPKVRNNLLEEMNPPNGIALFQKTHAFNKFSREQKRRGETFFIVREYGRHKKKFIQDLSKNHEYTNL